MALADALLACLQDDLNFACLLTSPLRAAWTTTT